jgi:hypothetical protein
MENRLLRMPFYGVNDSKSNEKLGQALSEFELSENSGFAFDCENVSEQIIAVDEILKNIDTEFPSEKYKTGKEYIDSLNERLYGAGLQYILDEVDKQLAEYYES